MAKKNYAILENKVIKIFEDGGSFEYNNKMYNIIKVGKPRPSSGECKTDVYILGECKNGDQLELKISIKTRSSNEFQENKLTPKKMEAYLGEKWQDIITKASISLKDKFASRPLIYVTKKHPTKENSITLGWKLEIASKARGLSVKLPLSDNEIRNYVYKGLNQPISKINSSVNGHVIENSGIADFLLVTEIDEINSTKDVIEQLQLIDTMNITPTYFIFTANNYRTKEDKADGPRNLAVYINWKCVNGKLVAEFIYDNPLIYTGENDIKPILLDALNSLGKLPPSDIDIDEDISSSINVWK